MKINAHLDVDMAAIESTDSVTVMLELQARPPPLLRPLAPSTPRLWSSTAPAPSPVVG